jgi:ADP-ribosylglycohydrolase
MLNKYKGCLLGLAVADALGAIENPLFINPPQHLTVRYMPCDIARILIR